MFKLPANFYGIKTEIPEAALIQELNLTVIPFSVFFFFFYSISFRINKVSNPPWQTILAKWDDCILPLNLHVKFHLGLYFLASLFHKRWWGKSERSLPPCVTKKHFLPLSTGDLYLALMIHRTIHSGWGCIRFSQLGQSRFIQISQNSLSRPGERNACSISSVQLKLALFWPNKLYLLLGLWPSKLINETHNSAPFKVRVKCFTCISWGVFVFFRLYLGHAAPIFCFLRLPPARSSGLSVTHTDAGLWLHSAECGTLSKCLLEDGHETFCSFLIHGDTHFGMSVGHCEGGER